MRVNDHYTYRELNMVQIGKNLTYVNYHCLEGEAWTGPSVKAIARGRIQFIEHLRHAKVPILKMRDSITGIDFDIS